MHTLTLSTGPVRSIAMVFDAGDEPMEGLTGFADDAGLDAAHFTAIGAFERATVGWFDLEARDYRRIEVDEQVEVLALVGDITRARPDSADDSKVHAHVVLGRSDGSLVGGHLLAGRVRPTLEVVLTETSAELRRSYDPATGLALIDLARSGGPAARRGTASSNPASQAGGSSTRGSAADGGSHV
jgi:hypothetical protein